MKKTSKTILAKYGKTNAKDITIQTRKLSDIYQSQSTKLHGCFFEEPFIILRDEASIVNAGYAKTCKAVVTLNPRSKAVQQLKKDLATKNMQHVIAETAKATERIKENARIDALEITEEFVGKIKEINATVWESGEMKSNTCASAMKALLQHNNIETFDGDFWKAFRILKAKAEKI